MLLKTEIDTYQERKQTGMFDAFVDSYATTRYGGTVVFMSFTIPTRNADGFMSNFKRRDVFRLRLDYSNYSFSAKSAKIELQRSGEYCNMLLQYKQNDEERLDEQTFALFEDFDANSFDLYDDESVIPANVIDEVADCIMSYTAVPFIKEWAPYVTKELVRRRAFDYAKTYGDFEKRGFKSVLLFSMSKNEISNILKFGLQNGFITIDGCNQVSERFKEASGSISLYLGKFGQELANHTTSVFKPAFNPNEEEVNQRVNDFFDVCEYFDADTKKYIVQKNIIEAAKRHFEKDDNFLLAGQMGVGKTLMGIGIVDASAWRQDYSAIVMAPPQLTKQWKEEITKKLPFSEVFIVKSLSDFLEVEKELKNPLRMRSLWVIMSYNTIKTTYNEHPAVVWSDAVNGYVCPHCGRPLAVNKVTMDNGVTRTTAYTNATAEDFLKEPDETKNKDSRYCTYVFDEDGNVFDDEGKPKGCGAKLWTVSTRDNSMGGCQSELWTHPENTDKAWIKIPGLGWVQKDRIPELKESIQFRIDNYDANGGKKHLDELKRWQKAIATYESRGAIMQYPRRYSIAKYLRKRLNKKFDFGIFDEVHKLSGDSKQGDAFGKVTNAVKKSIFLTGTLSSGYASGLFYILFRTQTHKMIEDGFRFDSVDEFQKKYGVQETTITTTGRLGHRRQMENPHRRTKSKEIPGISPTVAADYLMDNMVSVTQRDISNNLCKYSEVPVSIEADYETMEAYRHLIEHVTSLVMRNGRYYQADRRRIKNALNTADMFLDQPFGLDTSDEDGFGLLELSPDTVRPKEQKLIDLAREKKEAGEKMLVYVSWTQKTDVANRLARLLEDNDISAEVMGADVKPVDRSGWLTARAEEGNDVVIMNPRLVGEGLNLLEYTNIVFYEVGNELTIVRQASQRSNRINQENPVTVYYFYYKDTVQEDALALISQKLKASKAIEGDYTSSALQEMTEDTDILTKLVNSIVNDEHIKVDEAAFKAQEETPEEAVEVPSNEKLVEEKSDVHFMPTNFTLEAPAEPEYISVCA